MIIQLTVSTPIYYYYAVNSRGDVVGIYTASGSLLVVYEYDAWGNILSVKNANGVNIANPNSIANIQSLRYRGYCYDTDTGLYYLQNRYYDPVTHRFINADGYVSTGTDVLDNNMFAYCENNPILFSDPKGEGKVYSFAFVGPLAPGDIRLGLNGVEIGGRKKTSVGSAKPYVNIPRNDNPDPSSPNCYSYAIGSSVNEQPGNASGRTPTLWNDVYDVGESVKADMRAKGYSIRKISGPNEWVYSNEYKIALRVGTTLTSFGGMNYGYDYHFMRQTNTGQWAEKHGIGGESVLWDVGMTPDSIPWTLNEREYYDSDIIYYAIGE